MHLLTIVIPNFLFSSLFPSGIRIFPPRFHPQIGPSFWKGSPLTFDWDVTSFILFIRTDFRAILYEWRDQNHVRDLNRTCSGNLLHPDRKSESELIDNRLETFWNSKTGQRVQYVKLANAWVKTSPVAGVWAFGFVRPREWLPGWVLL